MTRKVGFFSRKGLSLNILFRRTPGETEPARRFRDIIRYHRQKGYILCMSYLTLEVEIDHGKVVPKEPERLPATGSGLLTIFQSEAKRQPQIAPLQALEALQKHLQLDANKAAEWMAGIREARR